MITEKPLTPASLHPLQLAAIRKLFGMGNLSVLLHSTQKLMKDTWENSGSEEYLVFCSRQLGKTHFGLCIAIETCIKYPGSRVMYYGPKKDKLKDIVNDGLAPILQFAPPGLIKRHKSEHRWTIGQSELRLCALERVHIDAYRGQNAKGLIVIEEGCFVDGEAWNYAWNSVIDPQRLQNKPKVLINTTPSVDEDHPIHTDLLPFLEARNALARYSIHQNPFLSSQDIEKIRARVTDETWRREYLAEVFRSKESVAVPEYDDSAVTTLTPPPFANWVTSIDFGGSLDPHGITLSYFDTNLNKFCVYKEILIPSNTSILEITEQTKTLEAHITKGRHFRVVDCSGQVSIELSKLSFAHMLPTKGPGSFDASLQAIRVGFQNNQILIDASCKQTRAQLKHGKLNKQKNDFLRTTSHHCDLIASLMYAFKHKQTDNPYPHAYGHSPQTHHISPKPPSKITLLGHSK